MKVNAIRIENILGVESLEIKPNSVTFVEGKNGAGKTSVLEAIKAVISGGHDATLLRNGADKGEIVLVLDNGVQIQKKVEAEKSQTTVTHPEYGRVSRPAEYIKKLADALSVNPVAFLTCPAKERANYLLEAMPLEIDPERVRKFTLNGEVPTGHAFDVLATLYNALYAKRRDVTRDLKGKKASIEELGKSLPEGGTDKDWKAEAERLEGELAGLKENERLKREVLESRRFEKLNEVDGRSGKREAEINTEYNKRLEALHEWKAAELHKNDKEATESEREITQHYTPAIDKLATECKAVAMEKATALATARSKAEEQLKAKNTQGIINRYKEEAEDLNTEVELYSEGLVGLDSIKQEIMENLPIKDLEVKNGEIYRYSIAFDRLNSTEQIRIAVEVAKLRAKDMGLICVDGIEGMDSQHIKEFEETIKGAGLQAIVGKVTDGPLRICREVSGEKHIHPVIGA